MPVVVDGDAKQMGDHFVVGTGQPGMNPVGVNELDEEVELFGSKFHT